MAKTYITDTCCGTACSFVYRATDEQPCWGEIHAVDEELVYEGDSVVDSYWIHGCEGHGNSYDTYIPPPPGFLAKTPPTPEYDEE